MDIFEDDWEINKSIEEEYSSNFTSFDGQLEEFLDQLSEKDVQWEVDWIPDQKFIDTLSYIQALPEVK